jgi:hypothetical protein
VTKLVLILFVVAAAFVAVRGYRAWREKTRPRYLPEHDLYSLAVPPEIKDAREPMKQVINDLYPHITAEPLLLTHLAWRESDGERAHELFAVGVPKAAGERGVQALHRHFVSSIVTPIDSSDYQLYRVVHQAWEQERLAEAALAAEAAQAAADATAETAADAGSAGAGPGSATVEDSAVVVGALGPSGSRPIPELEGASARLLTRAKHEAFLPLREPDSSGVRPLSLLLGDYSELAPGQEAFTTAAVRAVPDELKKARWQQERGVILGEVEQRSLVQQHGEYAGDLFGPLLKLTRLAIRLGWGSSGQAKPARPEPVISPTEGERRDQSAEYKARAKKQPDRLYEATVYCGVINADGAPAEGAVDHLAAQVIHALEPESALSQGNLLVAPVDLRDALAAEPKRFEREQTLLMTAAEAASLFHPADGSTEAHGLILPDVTVPPLDAPQWLAGQPGPGRILLGEVMPEIKPRPVYATTATDFIGGVFISGATGTGKSTWLESVIADLCSSGLPATVIDPNATLVEGALRLLAYRHPSVLHNERVVAIDFTDPSWPVSWNVLDCADSEEEGIAFRLAMALVDSMVKLTDLTRGLGYFESGVANLARANRRIAEAAGLRGDDPDTRPKLNILDLRDYFRPGDDEFRDACLLFAHDAIRNRIERFNEFKPEKQEEITSPLLDRLDTISRDEFMAATLGSEQQTIDFKQLLSEGVTSLFCLNLLGPQAEIGRALMAPLYIQYLLESELLWMRNNKRAIENFVVVDEASELARVAAPHIARTQAQHRKVGNRTIYASQFVEQMSQQGGPALDDAIEKNVVGRISFAVGGGAKGGDARAIFQALPQFDANTLVRLPRYHAVARLTMAPDPETPARDIEPFLFKSIDTGRPRDESHPNWSSNTRAIEEVYVRGRQRFARHFDEAEEERRTHRARILAELELAAQTLGLRDGGSFDAGQLAGSGPDQPSAGDFGDDLFTAFDAEDNLEALEDLEHQTNRAGGRGANGLRDG